jgi:hypothetical protein
MTNTRLRSRGEAERRLKDGCENAVCCDPRPAPHQLDLPVRSRSALYIADHPGVPSRAICVDAFLSQGEDAMNQPGVYLHWGVIQISLANLVVIGLMIAVFVIALLVPFPGRRK